MFLGITREADRVVVQMHRYDSECEEIELARQGRPPISELQLDEVVELVGGLLLGVAEDNDDITRKVVFPYPVGHKHVGEDDIDVKVIPHSAPGVAATPLDVLLYVDSRLKPVADDLGRLSLVIVPDVPLFAQQTGVVIDYESVRSA